MATIVTRASKGSALTWTEADNNITNLNNAKLENVVEDTTPQLGGNLDVNGNSIVSAANGNISITPNGTGSVVIDGNTFPQTQGAQGQILVADGGGLLEWANQEKLTAYVYNADSVTINKGEPVYVFSAQGDQISVKRALNTGDATSAQTLGLAAENIAATASGVVICQGVLTNVDTSTYTAGQALYLGATAGSKTTTKPSEPNHLVYLGFVEKVNASSGRIYVRVQNGYELAEIHDVNINNAVAIADNHYLRYNLANDRWQNSALDIINDTTPQLGGNLDVNGNSIVSASNGNINIVPNGTGNINLTPATGKVTISAVSFPTGTGTNGQVLTSDGAGNSSWSTPAVVYPVISDDTTTNSTHYLVFDDVTSGNASTVKVSSTKLTFNPSTGALTATSFVGPLTGNATTASTATTATNANNINIASTDGNTSDTTMSVVLVGAQATGNQQPHIDAGLTYNASTNALTATQFVGGLDGIVGSVTPAAGTFTTLTANTSASLKAINEGALYDLGTTGGTIAPNVANGNVQKITLNAALTINAFTSPVAGQSLTLIIYGGTAYTSITSTMKFAGGIKTLTGTAGCIDILSVYYDGTNYFASLGKGFA